MIRLTWISAGNRAAPDEYDTDSVADALKPVRGQTPAGTLTAALHRDPRVVRRGEGFWALNDDFGNDSAPVAEHDTGK